MYRFYSKRLPEKLYRSRFRIRRISAYAPPLYLKFSSEACYVHSIHGTSFGWMKRTWECELFIDKSAIAIIRVKRKMHGCLTLSNRTWSLASIRALTEAYAGTTGWTRRFTRPAAPWTALKRGNALLNALAEAFGKTRGIARLKLCRMHRLTGLKNCVGEVIGRTRYPAQGNFSCKSRHAHNVSPFACASR